MSRFGIDSEASCAGIERGEHDVHCISVCSDEGEHTGKVFWSREQFLNWLSYERKRSKIDTFYAFTLPFEYGTLAAWELLDAQNEKGKYPWQDWADEPINLFYIAGTRENKRIPIYDIRLFFYQLRYSNHCLTNLEKVADYLSDFYEQDIRKLPHPLGDDFGKRAPTDEERPYFERYAIRDAYICAKAAQWVQDNIITGWLNNCVDISRIFSWGTVAKYYFKLPRVNETKRFGRKVQIYLKAWHAEIFENTYAGRSEAFYTGGGLNDYYNDVSKLYTTAMIQSQAELIKDVRTAVGIDFDKLLGKINWQKFYEITGSPYGWIKGTFETHDDLWGLPIDMAQNNWYVIGKWSGLYNVLDLEASNVNVLDIQTVLLPIISDEPEFVKPMQKFEQLAQIVLRKQYKSNIDEYCIKNTLNSMTGVIGTSHPSIRDITNVPAYNTMLAQSHLYMSELFHKFHTPEHPISYIDTDSFFWHEPVNGVIRECEPCPTLPFQRLSTVPLAVGCKGAPKAPNSVAIFRGKMYCGLTDEGVDTNAFSAWKPFPKYFYQIAQTKPREIYVERQIVRKWNTRDRKATILRIGRWFIAREHWDYEKLCQIFRADTKRHRSDYNSYQLWLAGKHVASRAWTSGEALAHKDHVAQIRTLSWGTLQNW